MNPKPEPQSEYPLKNPKFYSFALFSLSSLLSRQPQMLPLRENRPRHPDSQQIVRPSRHLHHTNFVDGRRPPSSSTPRHVWPVAEQRSTVTGGGSSFPSFLYSFVLSLSHLFISSNVYKSSRSTTPKDQTMAENSHSETKIQIFCSLRLLLFSNRWVGYWICVCDFGYWICVYDFVFVIFLPFVIIVIISGFCDYSFVISGSFNYESELTV